MLAEIFMVRLEATARLASETVRPGGRFVPFVQGCNVAFKEHPLPVPAASPDRIEPSTY
jgi:hypothetical protein